MNLQEHSAYSTLLLEHFIDQLAEYIVLDSDVLCALCVHGSCDHQMSGLTCRSGIKAWLTEREWYKAVLRLWMETYQERMNGK